MDKYFCCICDKEIKKVERDLDAESELICDDCLSVLYPFMGLE